MPKVTIQLRDEVYTMDVSEGENLLLAAVLHSIPLGFECTSAQCGTCQIQVLDGIHQLNKKSAAETLQLAHTPQQSSERLACQSHVYGDVIVKAHK